jgi:hypothetical protein
VLSPLAAVVPVRFLEPVVKAAPQIPTQRSTLITQQVVVVLEEKVEACHRQQPRPLPILLRVAAVCLTEETAIRGAAGVVGNAELVAEAPLARLHQTPLRLPQILLHRVVPASFPVEELRGPLV